MTRREKSVVGAVRAAHPPPGRARSTARSLIASLTANPTANHPLPLAQAVPPAQAAPLPPPPPPFPPQAAPLIPTSVVPPTTRTLPLNQRTLCNSVDIYYPLP